MVGDVDALGRAWNASAYAAVRVDARDVGGLAVGVAGRGARRRASGSRALRTGGARCSWDPASFGAPRRSTRAGTRSSGARSSGAPSSGGPNLAVAAAAAPRLPTPARLFVAFVSAAGAATLALRLAQVTDAPVKTLAAALAIMLASVAADRFTLSVSHGGEEEEFSLADAVWVAAIVLAPPGAPTLGAAAGALCWQLARRRARRRSTIFNVGQVALALTAAEVIWGLAGTRRRAPTRPAPGRSAPTAAGAAFLVNARRSRS